MPTDQPKLSLIERARAIVYPDRAKLHTLTEDAKQEWLALEAAMLKVLFIYPPGSKVWVIHGNVPLCGVVKRVDFCHGTMDVRCFDIDITSDSSRETLIRFRLNEVHPTKEALIASL